MSLGKDVFSKEELERLVEVFKENVADYEHCLGKADSKSLKKLYQELVDTDQTILDKLRNVQMGLT